MSKHDDLKNREGVSEGDQFMWSHRHEAGLDKHYVSDVDMVMVDKHPLRVTAFADFKMPDEDIRFSQSVAYESLRKTAPVFIIRAEQSLLDTPTQSQTFTVERFKRLIDHRPDPPEVATEVVEKSVPWGGLVDHRSKSDFIRNGGDGLIGWEHRRRYPDKILDRQMNNGAPRADGGESR